MTKIQIELDIDDINTILDALGQLPFVRVYALIGRIQEQARAQVSAEIGPGEGERGEAHGDG